MDARQPENREGEIRLWLWDFAKALLTLTGAFASLNVCSVSSEEFPLRSTGLEQVTTATLSYPWSSFCSAHIVSRLSVLMNKREI